MQTQEQGKTRKHPPFPWKRLLIITAIFLFLAIAAIVLLLSTGHIIDYSWYYVIPVISALIIGPILTALQWLFPLSPIEARQQIQELTEREDNQKQTLLKNVEGLSSGVNISVYREKFGTPTFINHNEEKKTKEYVFVNTYFYLDAITDINDAVQYFAITLRERTFTPIFKSPGYPANRPSFQITLGVSTFSAIPGSPNYIVGWMGAHNSFYYETRYFGNPGHYEEFGFGLNEAGYLPNNAGADLTALLPTLPQHLETSENTDQILAPVQDLRTKVIFNTYAVSAPFVTIKDYAGSNLGVSYNQVRTLNT